MRRTVLTFALSAMVLAAFVVIVGPAALASRLADTDLLIFSIGLVSIVATLAFWSEGLRPLLADSGVATSRWRIAVAYTAAMFGRQVLPLGAIGGPAVTAYTVDREIDLGYEETLAIVAVAEFLSTIASLSMAGIGVLFLLGELSAVPQLRILVYGAAVFTVVLLGLGVLVLTERATVARAVRAGSWLVRVTVGRVSVYMAEAFQPARTAGALDRFYGTVDELGGNRPTLALVFALHFVGWVLAALPLYTSALALGVTIPLPLVFLLVATSGLVDILPMPGGLGGVEIVLGTLIAAVVGVALPLAVAVVMLYRICSYWFLLFLGAVASAYSAASVVEAGQ